MNRRRENHADVARVTSETNTWQINVRSEIILHVQNNSQHPPVATSRGSPARLPLNERDNTHRRIRYPINSPSLGWECSPDARRNNSECAPETGHTSARVQEGRRASLSASEGAWPSATVSSTRFCVLPFQLVFAHEEPGGGRGGLSMWPCYSLKEESREEIKTKGSKSILR